MLSQSANLEAPQDQESYLGVVNRMRGDRCLCAREEWKRSHFVPKTEDAVGVEGCNGGEDNQTFVDVQDWIKLIYVRHFL